MSDLSAIKLNGTTYTLSDDYARDSMAKIEYGTLATKAYNVGDYLINNNHLYRVTSAIAIGVKFTVGTNIELVKLTDEVKLKAPLASPTFTGTPKVPTASTGTKTTQIASTAYVQNEIDIVNNNVQSTIDYVQNELGGVLTSLRGDLNSLDSEVDTISDDVDSLDSAVDILTRQGTTLRNDGIVVCNAVDGGDNVFFMIDDTLTEAHKAADAKVTGDAIDALNNNTTDLKSASNYLDDVFMGFDAWVNGEYYNLSSSPSAINLNSPGSSPNYCCFYVECSPGDVFVYTGKGSSAAKHCAFLSDEVTEQGENVVLWSASGTGSETNRKYVAPANSAYALFNSDKRVEHHVYRIKKEYDIQNGTDIDTLTDVGDYYCQTATIRNNLINVPTWVTTGFLLEVRKIIDNTGGNTVVKQTIYTNSSLLSNIKIGYRIINTGGGTISDWVLVVDDGVTPFDVTHPELLAQGTDLDDKVTPGAYYCQSNADSQTMENVPLFVDSSFLLHVYNTYNSNTNYKRQLLYGNKYGTASIYTRQKNASDFGKWQLLIMSGMYENPMLIEPSSFVPTARVHGTAKKTIRVGTNNVAHYWLQGFGNNDQYLSEEPDRIVTWRRWLMKADLDFIFLQECEDYIDEDRTESAFDYLYKPFFDQDQNVDQEGTGTDAPQRRKVLNRIGLNTETVMETVAVEYQSIITYGYYNWCKLNITDVGSVMFINLHNFAGSNTNLERHEYEREQYLTNVLAKIEDQNPDYFIIAGDTNVVTATDKANLLSFCLDANATPVNGGILGWFATHSVEEVAKSYDNIIVSNNIRIDNVECDPVLVPGGFIWTDHTPVTATITFMNVEEDT